MSIAIKNLNHFYNENAAEPYQALFNVNLTINEGDIVGIAGSSGAGKSTLCEIMAGLTNPTYGEVIIDGVNIYANKRKKEKILARETRKKIGMVFQYSDYQLFEETVKKDIAFAPKEMGFSEEETEQKANRVMKLVNLPESVINQIPFNLSGGEKRKVAIAGILAFSPKYLILDEPTTGLDAMGKNEILNLILKLNQKENTTIIFISHSMENIAEIANKTIIMNKGEILKYDDTKNVFNDEETLEKAGLKKPKISLFLTELKARGFNVKNEAVKFADGVKEITEAMR